MLGGCLHQQEGAGSKLATPEDLSARTDLTQPGPILPSTSKRITFQPPAAAEGGEEAAAEGGSSGGAVGSGEGGDMRRGVVGKQGGWE
jgi:hypothetical protein